MSDIVERLRDMADYRHMDRSQDEIDETMREAATEIERLREFAMGKATIATKAAEERAVAAEARLAEARADALEAAAKLADGYIGMGWRGSELPEAIRALKSGGANG